MRFQKRQTAKRLNPPVGGGDSPMLSFVTVCPFISLMGIFSTIIKEYKRNSFIFRLSRLISLIVFILILGTNYYYFFIEAKMYGLSRDGIVGLLFICSILIIITIIFNWLCFGKFSIWIKKDKFSDE